MCAENSRASLGIDTNDRALSTSSGPPQGPHLIVLQEIPEAVLVFDRDLRCITASHRACYLLDLTQQELSGVHLRDLICGDDVARAEQALQMLERSGDLTLRLDMLTGEGDVVPVEFKVHALTGQEHVLYVVVCREMERKRGLEWATIQTNAELSALDIVCSAGDQVSDVQSILGRTLARVLKIFGLDAGCIYLDGEGQDGFKVAAHEGVPPLLLQEIGGVCEGWRAVFLGRKPGHALVSDSIVSDAQLSEAARREADRHDLHALVAVPLTAHGTVRGVMSLLTTSRQHPTGEAIDILELIGRQLGAAIERARRHREALDAANYLAVLNELAEFSGSRLGVEELSGKMLGRISQLLGSSAACLLIRNEDGPMRPVTWNGDLVRQFGGLDWVTNGHLPQLLATAESTPLVYCRGEAGWGALKTKGEASCIAVAPMMVEKRLVGVMFFAFREPSPLSTERLALLSALANHAGLVIRNAQLYSASQHLLINQERARIAREIHDGVAQSLAYLVLKTELIRKLLDRDLGRATDELDKLRQTLEDGILELRRCIYALRPVDLEVGGLSEALERLASEFGEQNELRVDLEIPDSLTLTTGLEGTIFRIVQEALNNVRKHARANSVMVCLMQENGKLRLVVEDDGVGFEPSESMLADGHLGLVQIRERAESFSGTATITSRIGHGTKVEVILPN